ncbi:hypothetical protein FA15DRAFT_495701 [Coprinopsis marcescibilis]|uniref:Galactose-binding like protein n=1 Tax=Coprinopsis marcescibilis TaxID=230819 RepID=A0A5C3KQY6_COPMA|nr:hypothetical protein FA15DRAFT_495701 [Coprinopsis marcescibilis]
MTRALQVTLFFVAFKATLATLVNRTIDDTIGDLRTGKGVSYSPAGAWTGPGQCPACWIQPDATLAHNGTFMETSYLPGTELAERVPEVSLSLEFRGTAIYVFFTYANDIGRSGATTRTECDIVLDNGSPVNIQREPDMSITELSYQQLFWHRTGLEDKDHTLVIHGRGPRRSYINFDYALYTTTLLF